MNTVIKAALLAFSVSLAACSAPSPERVAAASFALAETNQPLQLFSEACLNTLPNFDGFNNVVEQRGLTPAGGRDGISGYKAPGEKLMTATVATIGENSACGVGFLGADNGAEIGALFLQEAKKRTGGNPREKFPSSRFNYAYQLKNGSVMTQEIRKKSGRIQHIFLISKPVPREEVATYIYN